MSDTHDLWWDRIPSAAGFISRTAGTLENHSCVISLPENVPWYDSMYEKLAEEVSSSDRTIKRISDEGGDPGRQIMESFCRSETRNAYRSSIGYAKFLAANDKQSEMTGCCTVITNISAERITEWAKFVNEYEKNHKPGAPKCIFLLEYRSDTQLHNSIPLPVLRWEENIKVYDSFMYALLEVSMLNCPGEFKEYLAEIISSVSGSDVELASELAKHGKACAVKLSEIISEINENSLRSTGELFNISLDSEQIRSVVWAAQIKIIFPVIERFRNTLLKSLMKYFESDFRFETVYGDVKTDPRDLELGEIVYLSSISKISLTQTQLANATFFRNCRNTLAHFDTLSPENVEKALCLNVK